VPTIFINNLNAESDALIYFQADAPEFNARPVLQINRPRNPFRGAAF
jgi:hypothetical protein